MKKDIIIPEVENVFFAAVQEWSDDFMEKIWYAYLVNDSDFLIESVMVVSKAFGTIDGEMKKTSLLRHAFVEVPAVLIRFASVKSGDLHLQFVREDARAHHAKRHVRCVLPVMAKWCGR